MARRYFECKLCGQIVEIIQDTGVPIVCCGEKMAELFPEVEDGALSDKHIPVFKIDNNKVIVKIGTIPHPSTTDHYIEWIVLETTRGSQRKELKPGDAPEAIFHLETGELVKAIYAYCNIHQLWKVCVKEKKKPCGCDSAME